VKYYGWIPLIWHPQDWTGSRLSNVVDYRTMPILTKVLASNFLVLLLYFDCTANQDKGSIWISPSAAGSGASGSPCMFSEVSSIAVRDAEWPGEWGSGVFKMKNLE